MKEIDSTSTSHTDQSNIGAVSSGTPEATAAGIKILKKGGNAIDAAIAVSLSMGVTEPAGSGIGGQTTMLVQPKGKDAFVIHGASLSPRDVPSDAKAEQLYYGHTASTVPSTPRVLDLAYQRFGSGKVGWGDLVEPAIDLARDGFKIGPFRARAFHHYADTLSRQSTSASIFVGPDGLPWQKGEIFRQSKLSAMLERIADKGAMDFYKGEIAASIASDMKTNGGWITARDLEEFPEPPIVDPLRSTYRGWDVITLPPPFGGWVVIQALNILERESKDILSNDSSERRLALLDALRIAHGVRQSIPVTDNVDYSEMLQKYLSKDHAQQSRLNAGLKGGETTHFSVADGEGMAVSVTQSIDSYFGAGVVNEELGFLYNNYMQDFQVDDPNALYYLSAGTMPTSNMSATMLLRDGRPHLLLGSPGCDRIISAVTQVTSHWADVGSGIEEAVGAYRVHIEPPNRAFVEGEELPTELLAGMAERGLNLTRAAFGVADTQLDPFFGGVHALAWEQGRWVGGADPRRDGTTGTSSD